MNKIIYVLLKNKINLLHMIRLKTKTIGEEIKWDAKNTTLSEQFQRTIENSQKETKSIL